MIKKNYLREFILVSILMVLIVFEKEIESFLYGFFNLDKNPVQWVSLGSLMVNHMKLVVFSTSISLLVTLVIAFTLHLSQLDAIEDLLEKAANIGTTFPSVAIMALLVPALGYGFKPVFIALSVYAFLPMFIGTMSGLKQIDKNVIMSAQASGMNPIQVLFKIELPLAKRAMISGFKTALIINISSATLASVVGANSLGYPIVIGIRTTDMIMIFKGAFPVAVLAFLAESIISRFERIKPWQKQ